MVMSLEERARTRAEKKGARRAAKQQALKPES